MFRLCVCFACFGGLVWPNLSVCQAETSSPPWPGFRGGTQQAVVADGVLPTPFGAADYQWSVSLSSNDVGSPAIARIVDADRQRSIVYLTQTLVEESSIELVAFSLQDGSTLWRRSFPFQDRRLHSRNTPASTTPAVNEQYVYIAHGDAAGLSVRAYTHAGESVWSRSLGPWTGYHGFGGSPVVVGDLVVLMNSQQNQSLEPDQVPGESAMVALHRDTGEIAWQTPLKTTRVCYGVPAILTPEMHPELSHPVLVAANTGNGLFGIDPRDGRMIWERNVFDKRCCSSPVIARSKDGEIIAMASCGSGGGGNVLAAVRVPIDAETEPTPWFRIDSQAPYVPTPCINDGLIFAVADRGIASCWDLSGQRKWSQRLGGQFGASPVIIGDRLLAISLDGEATVMAASAEPRVLSQFNLGGQVQATPAVADGKMILRIGNRLVCLPL